MADLNFQRASTKNLPDHVKACAHTLRHSSLLTKLATSDMLAFGAVFHLPVSLHFRMNNECLNL